MLKIKDIPWEPNHPNGSLWSGTLLFGTYYVLRPIDDDESKRWEVEFGQLLTENGHETLYIVPTLEQAQKLAQEHFARKLGEWFVPENLQFIPWFGGECPVEKNKPVYYIMSSDLENGYGEEHFANRAGELRWIHSGGGGDIRFYRLA